MLFKLKPMNTVYNIPSMEANNKTNLNDRKYDIVLFGATGFTGRLACDYMIKEYFLQINK
jgi:hypothetical protein